VLRHVIDRTRHADCAPAQRGFLRAIFLGFLITLGLIAFSLGGGALSALEPGDSGLRTLPIERTGEAHAGFAGKLDLGRTVLARGTTRLDQALALPRGTQVLSTHVLIKPHASNRILQRTRDGFYVPWDGDADSLRDAGLRPSGGDVVDFKVLEGDLQSLSFPLTVVLAVRTPEGLSRAELLVEAPE